MGLGDFKDLGIASVAAVVESQRRLRKGGGPLRADCSYPCKLKWKYKIPDVDRLDSERPGCCHLFFG